MNKNVIYTAIIGNYDKLHDPIFVTPGWDYVCFSDDRKMNSDIWKIKYVDIDTNLSNRKNAYKFKHLYNQFVEEYEFSVWVDGYAEINFDFKHVYEYLKPEYDVIVLNHPKRKCLYDEAKYMTGLAGDPTGLVEKQIQQYRKDDVPEDFGLYALGMIARRKNQDNTIKHFELVFYETIKYSSLDQVSFSYVLWKYNLIKVRTLPFRFWSKKMQGKDHHALTKEEVQKNATF